MRRTAWSFSHYTKENIIYKEKKYIDEIILNLTIISVTIDRFNKLNLYDINSHSEDFFCKLLNIIYDTNLKNLNLEDRNIPSIDLGDDDKKICYQITSTNDSNKIKTTINKFEKYHLYDRYDELFILLLKNKKNYTTTFTTNKKYKFSKNNIIDIDNIILKIKSKSIQEIESINKFIQENSQIFSQPISYNKPKVENKINTLLLSLKTKAIEQYNLNIKVIEKIIKEYDNQLYGEFEFNNTEYINIIHSASLFFNSINEEEMNILLDFINIHQNISTKFATNMFLRHYNLKHDSKTVDFYLLENIIRILKSLKSLLISEIDITFSSGFGDPKSLLLNDSIILSISNYKKSTHKLITLNTSKEKIIEPEFCLGGVSEKVANIKSNIYLNNLFIFAQSNNNIYIWEPKLSHEPIAICEDSNGKISDYEIFIMNEAIIIIAITEENEIITWKVHNNKAIVIQKTNLNKNAYLLININGINRLINNNRNAKEIYKYDFTTNHLDIYFKIPNLYDRIISLSFHPTKNYIAFSCFEKNNKDCLLSDDFSYSEVSEFNKIIQYDIDNKIEFFSEKLEGHFIEKIVYQVEKSNVYLTIYGRDGAGIQYTPIIKKWMEYSNKMYNLIYQYDEYPKEKNNFFMFMKLFKNNIFVNSTEEPSVIKKLKNDKEIVFYKLDKDYIVNDLFCLSM